MGWIINDFNSDAFEKVKKAFASGKSTTLDYLGCFKRGALCFDIVLRDISDHMGNVEEWLMCADAFLLGIDSGYGYTQKGTPYDEDDSVTLDFDPGKSFDENLANIILQLDKEVQQNPKWNEFANKNDLTWVMED